MENLSVHVKYAKIVELSEEEDYIAENSLRVGCRCNGESVMVLTTAGGRFVGDFTFFLGVVQFR